MNNPHQTMTLDEYMDYNADDMADYFDELYWTNNKDYDSNEVLEWLLAEAKKDNVTITDTTNYDNLIHNAWQCTEKGLS